MSDQMDLTGNHYYGGAENEAYQTLVRHLKNTQIPDKDIIANLGLFLTRSSFGRIQFL